MEPGTMVALAALILAFSGAIAAAVWKVCDALNVTKSDILHKLETNNQQVHIRIDKVVEELSSVKSVQAQQQSLCSERHRG